MSVISDEDDVVESSPFLFDGVRGVMVVKSPDGSSIEITMNKVNMTSFVKNAAQVIKSNDIIPIIQRQRSQKAISAVDIALYNAEEDELANNTLASTFLDELVPVENVPRKFSAEKKASIIHSMFKLTNPRFQSSQQMHLSDQLRCDRASQRNLEALSKYGVGTSRKSVQKLLLVDHGNDHELLYERLLAEGAYGTKFVAVGHDNLQWGRGGQFCHSTTGFVIILDLEQLNIAYTEHFRNGNFTRLIEKGNYDISRDDMSIMDVLQPELEPS